MPLSRIYGKLDIPTIGEDEPVFILRGQDILAQRAIEMYRFLAEAHGCQVAEAMAKEMGSFQQWPGQKKLPVWPVSDRLAPEGRMDGVSKGERPSN